ncbi:hypothetical protein [Spirillospora sp. NPDC048824]|uniref:hypothetical protein n=1 Tax=Spirillospora sp. NPDC048824 TaxID=3364526 RepID=UPI00370FF02D
MPDIDNHQDRAYAETSFPMQHGFTVTEAADGLKVTGVCPACGGRTSMTFDYGPPDGVKGLFRNRAAAPPPPRAVNVYCDCGHMHADRPEDAFDRGCGAFWKIEMP